jgi:hypothetical protein
MSEIPIIMIIYMLKRTISTQFSVPAFESTSSILRWRIVLTIFLHDHLTDVAKAGQDQLTVIWLSVVEMAPWLLEWSGPTSRFWRISFRQTIFLSDAENNGCGWVPGMSDASTKYHRSLTWQGYKYQILIRSVAEENVLSVWYWEICPISRCGGSHNENVGKSLLLKFRKKSRSESQRNRMDWTLGRENTMSFVEWLGTVSKRLSHLICLFTRRPSLAYHLRFCRPISATW